MAAQPGRVDTVPPLHRDLGTRAGGAYAPWGFSRGTGCLAMRSVSQNSKAPCRGRAVTGPPDAGAAGNGSENLPIEVKFSAGRVDAPPLRVNYDKWRMYL